MDNETILAYLQRALDDSTDGPVVHASTLVRDVRTLVWLLQEGEKEEALREAYYARINANELANHDLHIQPTKPWSRK